MIKELKELVALVLSFGTDVFDAIRNSALPSSPSAYLTVDRSKALNLSVVAAIVLISIFIKTLPALDVKLEILPFALICIAYFMIAGLLVSLYLRKTVEEPGKNTSLEADSHSFVLGFNIVALLIFSLAVETAVFLGFGTRIASVKWIAAIGAVLVSTAVYLVARRWRSSKNERGYDMSLQQQVGLLSILSFVFVVYTRIIIA